MTGLVKLQPIDFAVTQGPRATFAESAAASFGREQEVGELTAETRFNHDVYEPLQTFIKENHALVSGFNSYQSMIGRGAHEDRPSYLDGAPTLDDFISELDAAGISYPDDIRPEALAARRVLGRISTRL